MAVGNSKKFAAPSTPPTSPSPQRAHRLLSLVSRSLRCTPNSNTSTHSSYTHALPSANTHSNLNDPVRSAAKCRQFLIGIFFYFFILITFRDYFETFFVWFFFTMKVRGWIIIAILFLHICVRSEIVSELSKLCYKQKSDTYTLRISKY